LNHAFPPERDGSSDFLSGSPVADRYRIPRWALAKAVCSPQLGYSNRIRAAGRADRRGRPIAEPGQDRPSLTGIAYISDSEGSAGFLVLRWWSHLTRTYPKPSFTPNLLTL